MKCGEAITAMKWIQSLGLNSPTATRGLLILVLTFLLLQTPAYATVQLQATNATESGQSAITIEPNQASPGAQVAAKGNGFLENEKVTLVWKSVEGDTVVVGGYFYGGHRYQNKTLILRETAADSSGSFSATITVPYDYGGYHEILANGSRGSNAHFTFFTVPQLTMNPANGPAGTKIAFAGYGFGWTHGLDDAWQVDYDNKYLGYFTSIKDAGNATFSIHASGEPGLHRISVFANPYGPTYLNLQEAFTEFARLPRFQFDFELTPGQPAEPSSEVTWDVRPSLSVAEDGTGTSLAIDPSSGAVGTRVNLSGSGFKVGEEIEVAWTSVTGAYISPSGFTNTSIPISSAQADSAGRFMSQFLVPYDVGGLHEIRAEGSSGTSANSTFYVARSAEISPTSGPPGTKIAIHIYGVGWKSWENIVALAYDNAYTGYACALGSQPGNITIFLTAIGSNGLHTIDLYPSIFRGPPTINYRSQGGVEPDVYRFPLLTPNELPEPIPIFHFEFIITGQSETGTNTYNLQFLWLLIPVAPVALVLALKIARPRSREKSQQTKKPP